jgi:hypothetical protein
MSDLQTDSNWDFYSYKTLDIKRSVKEYKRLHLNRWDSSPFLSFLWYDFWLYPCRLVYKIGQFYNLKIYQIKRNSMCMITIWDDGLQMHPFLSGEIMPLAIKNYDLLLKGEPTKNWPNLQRPMVTTSFVCPANGYTRGFMNVEIRLPPWNEG